MSVLPTAPLPDEEPRAVLLPRPFKIADIDQPTLLTVTELRLAADCRVSAYAPDRVIVKHDPTRTYLALTPAQWRTVQAFGEGRTVPQVLFQLISDRRCVPLREFYEIVVKAFALGHLQADGQKLPPNQRAARWSLRLSGRGLRLATVAALLGTVVALILRPMQLPSQVIQLLAGWVLACGALSLGRVLAAATVRHAQAEVYHPRCQWRTLVPHFTVDVEDAIMAGREARFDAALARLLPMAACTCLAAFLAPGLVLPLYCGVLLQLSPFWWTAGLAAFYARYGTPPLDALRRFEFEPNKVLWYVWRTRAKTADLRLLALHGGYVLVWLGLMLLTGALLLRAHATDLWANYIAAHGLHFTALALLALLGLMVLGAGGAFAWIGTCFVRDWWRERQHRRGTPAAPGVATPEAIAALLDRSLLFRHLQPAEKQAIAAACAVEEYPSRTLIIREGEYGDRFFLVFSGTVAVLKSLASGRLEPVATLGSGDAFGEIALLHSVPRTRSVEAKGPVVLLSLDQAAFQRLVLTRLSRGRIESIIQVEAFLRRIPLARDWSPHALVAFARRAVVQDFAEGAYIIREGEDNQFFYLLYEGELAVRRQCRDIAELRSGDFFGEISLLQNSVAKATIVARTPVRCLIMNKRDFLQFLSKDFVIGLQFEAISSQRLGAPIFPLKGRSFDVLRG